MVEGSEWPAQAEYVFRLLPSNRCDVWLEGPHFEAEYVGRFFLGAGGWMATRMLEQHCPALTGLEWPTLEEAQAALREAPPTNDAPAFDTSDQVAVLTGETRHAPNEGHDATTMYELVEPDGTRRWIAEDDAIHEGLLPDPDESEVTR